MRRALICILFVFACSASVALAGCGGSSDDVVDSQAVVQDDAVVGTADAADEFGNLISFEGLTLDGETVTQDVFASADVTVINFWATFCGPCLQEMPVLAEFSKQLPGNVQFMTACLDSGAAGVDAVQEILDDAGYEGVTILGGGGDFESLVQHIQYIPTTIAFDSKGRALGSAIVGSPMDVSAVYAAFVDDALAAAGAAGEEG